MCGIAGIFQRHGRSVDPGVLVAMTRTMTHRGPDEEGYFINGPVDERALHGAPLRGVMAGGRGNVGLGHRRLSIIDLTSGQQPLCSENGSVWVVLNGEIYNFQELVQELESKGHTFRTRSDTEVIVHAWEEWGDEAVHRFRGMFAFALWDENLQTMWLARDRVGKKPLYYLLDGERFIFGSELKSILEFPGVTRDIDLTSLSDYLSLLYVPAPKTIFKSISKLPAGHSALVTADSFRIRKYWDLSFEPGYDPGESRIMEEMLGILEEAVKLRMISDVPLGAFLSGGVDSSAVVAMMAGMSQSPVRTSSISFSVAAYNETSYARKVADLYQTDHREFNVTPETVPVIDQLAWHYDEPFADSSALPTYYVSKAARENVTVSLSGDGGDENFAGYRRYYMDLREDMVRSLVPAPLRSTVFRTLGRLYPKADFLPQVFRGKGFLSNVARDPVEAYFFSVSSFFEDHKQRVLQPELLSALKGYSSVDYFREHYNRCDAKDRLSRLQYLDIKTYLCEDILTKVDRASMAVSLEVRCPILDHRFMEYAARIPPGYKLNGRDGKHILKKAFKPRLPDEILYRRKMGFGVPVREWFRREIKDYAGRLILEGQASGRYLQRGELDRIWKEHQSGLRDWSTQLWTVMMLNLWHDKFA